MFSFGVRVLRVLVLIDYLAVLFLNFSRAPGPLRGSRERWPWHAPPRWFCLGLAARGCAESLSARTVLL